MCFRRDAETPKILAREDNPDFGQFFMLFKNPNSEVFLRYSKNNPKILKTSVDPDDSQFGDFLAFCDGLEDDMDQNRTGFFFSLFRPLPSLVSLPLLLSSFPPSCLLPPFFLLAIPLSHYLLTLHPPSSFYPPLSTFKTLLLQRPCYHMAPPWSPRPSPLPLPPII